ncbi:adenosylcobinamide-GDP ribazoletransferase [Halorubraceae archaeon YAN]|nr:adenosylcobinamide-GDP ribazoletransferase [Halorubraceae archaeon YAN]
MISAIRGAIGFLTRVPIATTEADWDAFRRLPVTIPLVGTLIGAVAGSVFLLPLPLNTSVVLYLVLLYLISGITHADGLADLGDGAVVHASATDRLAVMGDSQLGVGGTLLLGVTLLALTLGATGVGGTGSGLVSFRLFLAAEVGAKLAMVFIICYGTAAHDGLGSQLLSVNGPKAFGIALIAALPIALYPPPFASGAIFAALLSPLLVALVLLWWANRSLGGATGDVIGATNELGRVVGLHAGVLGWIFL